MIAVGIIETQKDGMELMSLLGKYLLISGFERNTSSFLPTKNEEVNR